MSHPVQRPLFFTNKQILQIFQSLINKKKYILPIKCQLFFKNYVNITSQENKYDIVSTSYLSLLDMINVHSQKKTPVSTWAQSKKHAALL